VNLAENILLVVKKDEKLDTIDKKKKKIVTIVKSIVKKHLLVCHDAAQKDVKEVCAKLGAASWGEVVEGKWYALKRFIKAHWGKILTASLLVGIILLIFVPPIGVLTLSPLAIALGLGFGVGGPLTILLTRTYVANQEVKFNLDYWSKVKEAGKTLEMDQLLKALESIEAVVVKKWVTNFPELVVGRMDCSICHARLLSDDMKGAIMQPIVGNKPCTESPQKPHLFHKVCIENWAKTERENLHRLAPTCPLCRKEYTKLGIVQSPVAQ